jgi:hypothetical protein
MADVTNKTQNTASVTNKELGGASSVTWDEATYTWDQAQGTWDNPFAITNKTQNTASMTNKPATS